MKTPEKIDIMDAADSVLKGIRGEETRKNLLIIINTVKNEMKNSPNNSVRAMHLQNLCVNPDNIPHLTTYYRLLKKLIESKIIQTIEINDETSKGKIQKYYFIPDSFNPLFLESREALLDRCIFLEKRLADCEELHKDSEEKFKSACKVLKGLGVKNPEEMVEDLLYD